MFSRHVNVSESVQDCVNVSLVVCFSIRSCVFVDECVSVDVYGCGSVVMYECECEQASVWCV